MSEIIVMILGLFVIVASQAVRLILLNRRVAKLEQQIYVRNQGWRT